MQRGLTRKDFLGGLLVLCLVLAVANIHAATTAPTSSTAQGKLQRLKIAVAPLGWDTNYTWLQRRSGQLEKRPALGYLIGIDRQTGA